MLNAHGWVRGCSPAPSPLLCVDLPGSPLPQRGEGASTSAAAFGYAAITVTPQNYRDGIVKRRPGDGWVGACVDGVCSGAVV